MVEEGSLAVILTDFIDSFKLFSLSKSSPFGLFFVVVLHSYPPLIACELLLIIIGLNGGTSSSFSASPTFADGDVTLVPWLMQFYV